MPIAPSALAVALLLAGQAPAADGDPCRRSHCTLAGSDLPLVLLLAEHRFADDVRLLVAPGLELGAGEAAAHLRQRHRQGHGGWPEWTSSQTLTDLGFAGCDPAALDALTTIALGSARGAFHHIGVLEIARWLECNGRYEDAERLLLQEVDPEDALFHEAGFEYGQFLARRGRFAEALRPLETYERFRLCGDGARAFREEKFDWIERCCIGLHGGSCAETLFEKRLEIVGVDGLAAYVAANLAGGGSSAPEREARLWVETTLPTRDVSDRDAADMREQFLTELEAWTTARTRPPPAAEYGYDWDRRGAVERAVARLRELVREDPAVASALLLDAAATAHPAAGRAVLELAADPTIAWTGFRRAELLGRWRDAILTRTFGCADPEDPSTW